MKWALMETEVIMGLLEIVVKTDQRGRRVSQDSWESLDLQALLEKRANLEFRDCLDIPAGRGPRDQWAFLEQLGWKERKESGDLLDRPVPMAKEVQMVHVGEEEHEDRRGSQEPRAPLVMTAHKVPQEREALKDHKDAMERPGQRDQMVLRERTGCQVTQANEESQDFKERRVLPGLLE